MSVLKHQRSNSANNKNEQGSGFFHRASPADTLIAAL